MGRAHSVALAVALPQQPLRIPVRLQAGLVHFPCRVHRLHVDLQFARDIPCSRGNHRPHSEETRTHCQHLRQDLRRVPGNPLAAHVLRQRGATIPGQPSFVQPYRHLQRHVVHRNVLGLHGKRPFRAVPADSSAAPDCPHRLRNLQTVAKNAAHLSCKCGRIPPQEKRYRDGRFLHRLVPVRILHLDRRRAHDEAPSGRIACLQGPIRQAEFGRAERRRTFRLQGCLPEPVANNRRRFPLGILRREGRERSPALPRPHAGAIAERKTAGTARDEAELHPRPDGIAARPEHRVHEPANQALAHALHGFTRRLFARMDPHAHERRPHHRRRTLDTHRHPAPFAPAAGNRPCARKPPEFRIGAHGERLQHTLHVGGRPRLG